jgi:hypothetical protein
MMRASEKISEIDQIIDHLPRSRSAHPYLLKLRDELPNRKPLEFSFGAKNHKDVHDVKPKELEI